MNQLNGRPSLPPELLQEIAQLLSPTEIRAFSLVSRLTRAVALPFIFGDLSYYGELPYKVGCINRAGKDVKAVVRRLSLSESSEVVGDEAVIFRFLESIPNLETLSYSCWKLSKVDRPSLRRLIASVARCRLRNFEFWFPMRGQGHPTPGPSGLQSLTVYSYAAERTTKPTRDQYLYLYKLIQPSFTTLVELKIHLFPNGRDTGSVVFDLRQLKPLGATLRSLVYYPGVFDSTILDTIPETFPLISKLDITFLMSRTANANQGSHWKDAYDVSLAKNVNLQYLKIYADFRPAHCTFFHRFGSHCPQCAGHRLRATQALALACKELEHCQWYTFFEPYRFNVTCESGSDERVVRFVDK